MRDAPHVLCIGDDIAIRRNRRAHIANALHRDQGFAALHAVPIKIEAAAVVGRAYCGQVLAIVRQGMLR
ncbi:MAG TPA: hypothetical protein DEH22_02090 [Chloroflexi bacterium]|nr:hypothetical protein [Chloroflexota bacterium]